MKMDLSFGTKSLLHRRYTRVMKAMLPRKRTSKLRVLQNLSWNQEEDSCYIRITHFSKLDFCNEINDNVLNEALALNKLKRDSFKILNASDVHPTDDDLHRNSYDISNAVDVSPTIDDLTPPATPFGSSMTFLFDASQIPSTVPSIISTECLPLTPATPNSESHMFTFQDSQVSQNNSIADRRALFLQSLMT